MKDRFHIPGLVGVVGSAGYSERESFDNYYLLFKGGKNEAERITAGIMSTPFGVISVLGRGNEDVYRKNCFAEDDCYAILKEGEIFSSDGQLQTTRWLLQAIKKYGISSLDSLNGTYLLAIYDKNKKCLVIRTDRYSTRLFYIAEAQGFLLFSNDLHFILRHPLVKHDINHDAILDFLSFEFILCNETFYNSIQVFPHGKQLVWDGKRVIWSTYWDYPSFLPSKPDANVKDYKEETMNRMRQAVRRRVKDRPHTAVTLSAGLDSRANACFLNEVSTDQIMCIHLGSRGASKTEWARMICKNLNGEFKMLSRDKINYKRFLPIAAKLLGGQVSLNQAEIFWLLLGFQDELSGKYILDGQVQDVILEPLYISNKHSQKMSTDLMFDTLCDIYEPAHPDLLKIFVRPEWVERGLLNRKNRILRHLENKSFQDFSALTQYFYMTTRGQRYVWGQTSLEFALNEIGFPGMDYDLFDFGMKLPLEVRHSDARLYREILCSEFSSIAEIPWDATGEPLSVYTMRNQTSKSKHYLLHIIRRLSLGKLDYLSAREDPNRLFRNNAAYREAFMEPLEIMEDNHDSPISREGLYKLASIIMHGRNYFQLYRKAITIVDAFNQRYQ